MRTEVLLLAEGSGGHLIPALETARVLIRRGMTVHLWYAERRHMGALLDQQSLPEGLTVRSFPTETRGFFVGLLQAVRLSRHARHFLRERDPVVVMGFGGRFSVPVILSARLLRSKNRKIALALHEQNKVMGRANRRLARFVDKVALSFKDTDGVPAGISTEHVGMPVRVWPRSLRGSEDGSGCFNLLVLGGSQGARSVNERFVALLSQLSQAERERWRICHITGTKDYAWVKAAYAGAGIEASVMPLAHPIGTFFREADVFVGRAGASSLAEAAQCGIPAVLIPYPYANAHQTFNARHYESAGGAVVIRDAHASARVLLKTLRLLYQDRSLRERMGQAMLQVSRPDAADRLSDLIGSLGQEVEPITGQLRAPKIGMAESEQPEALQKACV